MAPTTVRILVVGDAGAGKTALVAALCGGAGGVHAGCAVRVRVSDDGRRVEEFYDVCAAPRFEMGRALFMRRRNYDAVLLVHDLADPASRAGVSRVWVPEVMAWCGDVEGVEAGGRGEGVYVSSRGVVNELRFLWMHARSAYSDLSIREAMLEGVRLLWRFGRLLLSELGIWNDSSIDAEVERELLASSAVPVAIVGMKLDLVDRSALPDALDHSPPIKGVVGIRLHSSSAAMDSRLAQFLRRAGESAERKANSSVQTTQTNSKSTHVAMPF